MKPRLAPLFSSASVHWATPAAMLEALRGEFGPLHDPCPLLGYDMSLWDAPGGLMRPWESPTYVNPPYGRAITRWLQKVVEEVRRGVIVVALIPSRTDTSWWHKYVMEADEIRFLRGRLRFGNAKNSAPFPSALAIWNHAWRTRGGLLLSGFDVHRVVTVRDDDVDVPRLRFSERHTGRRLTHPSAHERRLVGHEPARRVAKSGEPLT